MDRRGFLAAAAATAAGFAGCAAGPGTRTPSPTAVGDGSLAAAGFPPSICGSEIVTDAGIEAIVDPATAPDWAGVAVPERYGGGSLGADDVVVGVERGGRARAYPLAVLWRHEVVNDDLGGPLLASFCPLCNSGMVASRVLDGAATRFGVSGQLWTPPELYTRASELDGRVVGASADDPDAAIRNTGNLVLYDAATASFWSQLLAEAICGPRTGERLRVVPSTATTWGEWRADHPGTDVLLPPPHSTAANPEHRADRGG